MDAKPLRVGILGLGTIGTGVAQVLLENADNLGRRSGRPVVFAKGVDLDITTPRGITFPEGALTTDAHSVLDDPEIDVIVEVIGGTKPARDFILRALKNGKHVVTSNKEVVAKHLPEFVATAKEAGVNIYYEAAVGGGIPIIHAMKNSLAANNFSKVFGIMNGTTNYILTKMKEEGADFGDVLAEAQRLGYAEADPTADVDGYDVAYKLAILASIAFNARFQYEDIHFEGIRQISQSDIAAANELGYVIKLVAVGIEHPEGDVELRVHPVMIDKEHPLASVNGSFNAVFAVGNYVDETMLYGRGAGMLPTASAVVGDVLDIAMEHGASASHPSISTDFAEKKVRPMAEVETEFFVRLRVRDEAGVLASLTRIAGDEGVSILTLHQRVDDEASEAEITLITHLVRESAMQQAIARMKELDAVLSVEGMIRVGL